MRFFQPLFCKNEVCALCYFNNIENKDKSFLNETTGVYDVNYVKVETTQLQNDDKYFLFRWTAVKSGDEIHRTAGTKRNETDHHGIIHSAADFV